MNDSMTILKQTLASSEVPCKLLSLKRKEFAKHSRAVDTNLYLIKSGSVRVFNIINEEEHCLYLGYQGSIVTATDSFFSGTPSDYYIQAIKQTEIEIIRKEDFLEFVHASKTLMKLWQDVLIEIIQHHIERNQNLMTTSSVERYERLLQKDPKLFQQIPLKYIASYLRMSPETLSRLKKS